MRKLFLAFSLVTALFFMAGSNLHAMYGTYIHCIQGCPDHLIVCTNCCNEVFSSILRTCDVNRDQCEALCPPGDTDCLDWCVVARNHCLLQDAREFDCPYWK